PAGSWQEEACGRRRRQDDDEPDGSQADVAAQPVRKRVEDQCARCRQGSRRLPKSSQPNLEHGEDGDLTELVDPSTHWTRSRGVVAPVRKSDSGNPTEPRTKHTTPWPPWGRPFRCSSAR